MIFLSAAALQDDDSFDFHKPVEGQFLDGHAGTGGAVRIENSRVGFVDFLEVGHAGQEHGSFDDVLFRGSHFSQQRLDILQGLAGLGAYAAFSQFAGCGIDAQLAGKVDGVSGTVALGVKAGSNDLAFCNYVASYEILCCACYYASPRGFLTARIIFMASSC